MPRHLLTQIIQETLDADDPEHEHNYYRDIQLVCKSWKAALLELSAVLHRAVIRIDTPADLSQACQMLPSMSFLVLRKETEFPSLRLDPLSACSRLSRLDLDYHGSLDGRPKVDLDYLPRGLRQLGVEDFEMTTQRFDFTKCVHLTSLTLLLSDAPQYEFYPILESWQSLKVTPFPLCRNALLSKASLGILHGARLTVFMFLQALVLGQTMAYDDRTNEEDMHMYLGYEPCLCFARAIYPFPMHHVFCLPWRTESS